MEKSKIGRTAQVNLCMLAALGVPEAIEYQKAFGFEEKLLARLPRSVRLSVGAVAEVLYTSANHRIESANHPVILDLACGYGPRAYKMIPKGYRYIGGDLPSVVEAIREKLDQQSGYEDMKALYRCIDVTDQAAVEEAVSAERGTLTVVTQGLLTYLNAEQLHLLAGNVHALLEAHGGCWIIPDASPDKMLNQTFQAIAGGTFFVKLLYSLRNRMLKSGQDTPKRRTTDEIVKVLQAEGFRAEALPLWEEGMELRVFEAIGERKAAQLKNNWKELKSVIVRL